MGEKKREEVTHENQLRERERIRPNLLQFHIQLHHFANFYIFAHPNFILSTWIGGDYGKLSKIQQKIHFLVYAVSTRLQQNVEFIDKLSHCIPKNK